MDPDDPRPRLHAESPSREEPAPQRLARPACLVSFILALLAAASLVAPGLGDVSASLPAEGKPAADHSGGRRVGVSSCAAFACHGGNGPLGDSRSAYTTWMALDPHSRAYTALLEEPSRDIEARLGSPEGREPPRPEADVRCLTCHSPPGAGSRARGAPSSRPDGVDCETCHGPARDWLEPHSRSPETWKDLAPRARRELGMTPTTGLADRARLCVGCHVGESGREVDHDLIAAGHPRLHFESRSFLDALPEHWDRAKERRTLPDFEARAWAIGQVVSAEAALGLLAARAREVGKAREDARPGLRHRPWPEFSEYDCASCHHDLSAPGWPSDQGPARTPPGVLRWGTWYYPLARALTDHRRLPEISDSLRDLRRLLGEPDGDPIRVAHLASNLSDRLGTWLDRELEEKSLDARGIGSLLDSLAGRDPGSWDEATQLSLAIAALEQALVDQGRPAGDETVGALLELTRQAATTEVDRDPATPARFLELLNRYHDRRKRPTPRD